MADTNDTIDGLLAEFRGYAAGMPPSYHVTMSWHDFSRMLDRFDAAHRRERGDCAKLREACANIAEYARSAMCHATDAHLLGYLNQIEGWSKAALSVPPRNCDRFATAEEARQAWLDDAGNWDEFGSPRSNCTNGSTPLRRSRKEEKMETNNKMREALTKILHLTNSLDEDCAVDPVEIRDIARAALAAPARNCDVYTADELKVEFNSELVSELPIANDHEKNLVAITAMGVIDTLLAPATEKEGGAK